MHADNNLARFIKEKYGTITRASEVLGIEYQTLRNNVCHPSRGYLHIDRILNIMMEERDDAIKKYEFIKEEYERLAKEYNALVESLDPTEEERL